MKNNLNEIGEKEDLDGMKRNVKDLEKQLWEQQSKIRTMENEKEVALSNVNNLTDEIQKLKFLNDQLKQRTLGSLTEEQKKDMQSENEIFL